MKARATYIGVANRNGIAVSRFNLDRIWLLARSWSSFSWYRLAIVYTASADAGGGGAVGCECGSGTVCRCR